LEESIPPDCCGLVHQVARGLTILYLEASTVAYVLVTNFYCRLKVWSELHSEQGQNFLYSTPAGPGNMKETDHPSSDGMLE
jgi:hypothetical protein